MVIEVLLGSFPFCAGMWSQKIALGFCASVFLSVFHFVVCCASPPNDFGEGKDVCMMEFARGQVSSNFPLLSAIQRDCRGTELNKVACDFLQSFSFSDFLGDFLSTANRWKVLPCSAPWWLANPRSLSALTRSVARCFFFCGCFSPSFPSSFGWPLLLLLL